MVTDKEINEGMAEILDDWREWNTRREEEILENNPEDPEEPEIDMEEYAAFFLGMAELVAMHTADIGDRGQNGLN